MSSISICLHTTLPKKDNGDIESYEESCRGDILHKGEQYTVVKLKRSIDVYFPDSKGMVKYHTRYLRLDNGSNRVYVYIPCDRTKRSTSVLEHILSVCPDIVRTYAPMSKHSWREVESH